ncbi:MAG: D-2-hydroxyacid dehydrogenase [Synechococcaceae cyanobacterium]|nr:D-2-hydroxyacid dehydrogenase [Synechococcaceae cyanobacterium]
MPAPRRPRLVILDGHTTNPGDLSWEPLQRLGELSVHARSAPEQVAERIADADVVLTNKTPLPAVLLASARRLRGIAVLATGFDVVDVAAARQAGLPVCNVPEYGTSSVAQAVFALLLELTNHTGHHSDAVRRGRWSAGPDFCFWDGTLQELAGLRLGLVGRGRIARAVARIGEAFGMEVRMIGRPQAGADGEAAAELDGLLAGSDVVSLHCPLTAETRGLIDAARLARMKPGALLINTARGALVVEADLAAALHAGQLGGAALDVLSVEPPPLDHPLLQAPNCLITPHIAWASLQARRRLIAVTAANVEALLRGEPQHLVNGPLGGPQRP